ncbi:MAG TPA: trypsin-like peptidase domain-containing protein [Tepidisphaeraceae bacterium]|jgi:serine protease Do|nr:trypsin-like peptidase domain-containing protein [Tepidisphaeraceae bacterium]
MGIGRLPSRRAVLIGLALVSLGSFSLNLLTPISRTFAAEPTRAVRSTQPTDTLQLADLQNAFESVARDAAPSVVAISAAVSTIDADDVVRSDDLNPQKLSTMLDRVTRTVGTGFFVDSSGYIVTNEHVIADAQQLWVTTDDRKIYPAIVVGSDPRADLAVLKIPAKDVPVVKFAKPDSVKRGEWTIAIGNPYGLAGAGDMAMSVGVVSALNRSLPKLSVKEDRNYSNLIQTTAEINPGNSGGPLFNLAGEVIGINAAVILPQKETSGIGFAFPITQHLSNEIQSLKQGREIVYGYLGVTVSTPSLHERKTAGLPQTGGVSIDSVEKNSPASESLRPGDILLSINDQSITDSDQFADVVGITPVDSPAKISLVRDGLLTQINVKLAARASGAVAVTRNTQRLHWRGLVLGPIPTNWDFGKSKRPDVGVMVLGVTAGSPLATKVTIGSIITAIAGKPLKELQDLQTILNDTPSENCNIELASGSSPQVASAAPSQN